MAIGYIIGGGGGGVTSSEVTAKKENVLAGKTTVTSDSDDAVVNGTMPNIGKVTQTLGVNGSYTIPKGYHDGTGKVTQNLVTKAAQTYYAGTSDQTISSGQYLTGAQTIKKVTQSGMSAANVVKGKTITVNNGNSNIFSVTGTAQEFAHASGTATSGSTYQDSANYTYPLIIDLPFIPVTGYVITYKNYDRDITIVDPNHGGGKQNRMVNFNQQKMHNLNSIGYAEGGAGYTCTAARVVLPVSYGGQLYHYFFSGYKS